MPKYSFECQSCNVRFERVLKIGDNATHSCPSCKELAPRLWQGQGFGFGFASGEGTQIGNSGVTKHDYPTADQAVGSSAEARWSEIQQRENLKKKVREQGGSAALVRENGPGNTYIEYAPMTAEQRSQREKLATEAKKVAEAAENGE